MKYAIPAVIFSGGKSSRMGRDKALLPFGGYASLSHYQYMRLQHYFSAVYLSAKEDKFDFEASLIYDRYALSSPLVAILSVFEILKADEVFVLSVDAPFVNGAVVRKLMEERQKGFDAVIARTPGGVQPLCGVYRRSLMPLAYRQLEEKRHRLTALLEKGSTHYVTFEDERPFLNVNHPHEYEAALCIKGEN